MAEQAAANTDSIQKDQQSDRCPHGCINGFILTKDENGYEQATLCECEIKRRTQIRFKNAEIPEEYENARFQNFKQDHPVHRTMYKAIMDYLKEIPPKDELERDRMGRIALKAPSFGFIAEYGEMRLKDLPAAERFQIKKEKNSYGIGKTHLTMAAAKYLINKGYKVFCISDITYLQDLMAAKQTGDIERVNGLISNATHYADIIVWDELGRSRYSEAREDMYYQIINELYKQQKPIIFSSNEDKETLEFKIGPAAYSRLKGMAKGNIYELSGPDMR